MKRILISISLCVVLLAGSSTASAATLNASPSNLATVFASAQAGDTILLAAGSYGAFKGGQKSGPVVLVPQAGATASMNTTLTSNQNVVLDGIKFGGLEINGASTKNVTIRNSDFTGSQLVLRTGSLANSNVDIDNDRFVGFNKCSSCYEGRVQLAGSTSQPDGVTIRNSYFSQGESDGIQNGGNGTRILDNTFENIVDDPNLGPHADAVQLYGSSNSVIRGNLFRNVPNGVVAFDGSDHETIENNVISTFIAVTLVYDRGSIVRHNTMPGGRMRLGWKPGTYPGGTGTVVKDNVYGSFDRGDTANTVAEEDYNLPGDGSKFSGLGAHDITGRPVFVGGASPSTFEGYALAAGSPGKANASDGSDRGITVGSAPAPTPAPTPSPTPTPTPTPSPSPTPTPSPSPTPTPTPAPASCDSVCEQAYKDQVGTLQGQVDALKAKIAAAQDALN